MHMHTITCFELIRMHCFHISELLIEDSYRDLLSQSSEVRSQVEQAVLELCQNPSDINALLQIVSYKKNYFLIRPL